MKFATNYHMYFLKTQLKRIPVATNNDTHWFPPNRLAVKVNFNRARFQQWNLMGLGDVIRDTDGRFLVGH